MIRRVLPFLSALKPTRLGVLFAVLAGLGVGFWQWPAGTDEFQRTFDVDFRGSATSCGTPLFGKRTDSTDGMASELSYFSTEYFLRIWATSHRVMLRSMPPAASTLPLGENAMA